MKQRIAAISPDAQTPAQKSALKKVRSAWGRDLNISDAMAHNPKVLEGFLAFWTALDNCGLSHEDREVICMEMAVRNDCRYCVPAHLNMSGARGVDIEMITCIASGLTLSGDSRAAKLQCLTRDLVETGGQLSDAMLKQAHADGFDSAQLIAIIAEVAHCHFTNSFNRLAQTEPDPHFPPAP